MSETPRIVDRATSRDVDRIAVEEYGILGIVLMENAARALAASAMQMLAHTPNPRVLIVCGSGNNGGDGYAAARHLHNAGSHVTLCALGTPRDGTDASVNRTICERMQLPKVEVDQLDTLQPPHLIIDAIFGTGLDREVDGRAAIVIRWINKCATHGVSVLAADIPSGLDCDTGRELGVAVRAHRTVSFVGVKQGFLEPDAAAFTGEVVVGDIGVPIELVKRQ